MQVFQKLGWSYVASLTQDGHKYSEYISHLQDMLQKNEINFIMNRKFREDFTDSDMRMVSPWFCLGVHRVIL